MQICTMQAAVADEAVIEPPTTDAQDASLQQGPEVQEGEEQQQPKKKVPPASAIINQACKSAGSTSVMVVNKDSALCTKTIANKAEHKLWNSLM